MLNFNFGEALSDVPTVDGGVRKNNGIAERHPPRGKER
jgi:hypothetical protein